jgi:hypothetical protein
VHAVESSEPGYDGSMTPVTSGDSWPPDDRNFSY